MINHGYELQESDFNSEPIPNNVGALVFHEECEKLKSVLTDYYNTVNAPYVLK